MGGRWEPTDAEKIDGNTGTTYRVFHEGTEYRVRVRSDRKQVEFWVAGTPMDHWRWSVGRVQINNDGAGVNLVPSPLEQP